mmetsp:Transcript_18202/g.45546  ORF Transcript_18202/g.45546 Transcript_18202/m.45546 type:complete len:235 (+) Transcript_18202:789-1493(+)
MFAKEQKMVLQRKPYSLVSVEVHSALNAMTTPTTYEGVAVHDVKEIDSQELSYECFFLKYLSKNIPAVIKNVANNWRATKEFCHQDGSLDLVGAEHYFCSSHGSESFPIAKCDEQEFSDQRRIEKRLSSFFEEWKTCNLKGKKYDLYLKDLHFYLVFMKNRKDLMYEVPIWFSDDWLNPYCDGHGDGNDYRFLYTGPSGSWTPLHTDVFNSHSWSVNVAGRKRHASHQLYLDRF